MRFFVKNILCGFFLASSLSYAQKCPSGKEINLNNWELPPYNQWAFQHIQALIPTQVISKGAGPVYPFEYVRHSLERLKFRNSSGKITNVKHMLEQSNTDGFLVIYKGKIVTEIYFNCMKPRTLHLSESVSKSLTGALTGILVAENKINLNKQVSFYIPELKDSAYGNTTINQLLNMTTGMDWSEDIANPKSEVTIQEYIIGWRPPKKGLPSSNHAFLKTLKQARPNNEIFEYKSADNDVLSWVMEKATKTKYADLLSQYLWSKLGAEEDARITIDKEGSAISNGGFNATLRDLGRFGQMVLNNGYFNNQQIVPSKWVATFRHGNTEKFKNYQKYLPLGAYSNQWWIINNKTGVFSALGIYGQYIYINPQANVVIVKLSSWPSPINIKFNLDFYLCAEAISDYLVKSSWMMKAEPISSRK